MQFFQYDWDKQSYMNIQSLVKTEPWLRQSELICICFRIPYALVENKKFANLRFGREWKNLCG